MQRHPIRAMLATAAALMTTTVAVAQDPNFHIYLAFGQSNMEGQAPPESQDKIPVGRFKVMSAVNCSSPARSQGAWAPAIAPIVRCFTNLSPLDHFGRTLVDSLPPEISIGVVPVAVAGSKIEGFDSSTAKAYYAGQPSWMQSTVAEYGGNPYVRLVSLAKAAQKSGIIKGVLLHQGESNVGDPMWASKVKTIYDKLMADLGLDPAKVPLLAGEVAPTGNCAAANPMIDALPRTIPTSRVISAKDLTVSNADGMNVHFDAASYRELGRRYARSMLAYFRDSGIVVVPPVKPVVTDSVVVTTFDIPYHQNPRQTDLAAKLGIADGGMWWTSHDDSGSTTRNGLGKEVASDTAAMAAAIDGGFLHLKMTTSSSKSTYPYAALETHFTDARADFDLRRLSKMVVRIKGTTSSGGSLRVYFKSRDVQVAGDWGNYGVATVLTPDWTDLEITAEDLAPTPWSGAATKNWTWADSGARKVHGIGFSVGSGVDADLWIDRIVLMGIDSEVFNRPISALVRRPGELDRGGWLVLRERGRIRLRGYSPASQVMDVRILDLRGRLLASFSSQTVAGVNQMDIPFSADQAVVLGMRTGRESWIQRVVPGVR